MTETKPSRRPAPASPWRHLLKIALVFAPLMALPFALFFMLISQAPWRLFGGFLQVSLVFSYTVYLAIWGTQWGVMPLLGRWRGARKPKLWEDALPFVVASLLASGAGAWIIDTYIYPGFIGDARGVARVAVFSLLFCVLFLAIALAAAHYRDSVERARSDQELNLARRIQRAFLLSQFPEMPRLEVHAVNVSSRHVSGDFYDVVPAGEGAFLLAVADVSGKGVPAALLSSMLQASLRTQAPTEPSAARILATINQLVCRSFATGQFATFFLARIEERTLALTYSNAGHNFPLVFGRDGSRRTLEKGGTVVGILDDLAFEEETITLVPGDRLVLYTDGISEAAREDQEQFGEERLEALLRELPAHLSAREVTERILGGVHGFLDGVEPGDDMTVMVLRVLEPVPANLAGDPPAPAGVRA
jgi:serine phosphatase RsbU (regulator of sigma subunit)